VTIPAHHPGASPKNYFVGAGHSVGWAITSGLLPLAAHVILGILLVVAGFVLISLAASSDHRGVLIASVLAAMFILGAPFQRASFLNFNDDPSSMIMAGLFAAALACYVVVLFQLAAGCWPTRLLLTVARPRYRRLERRASGDLARSAGEL
jgi:uncharacterized membrane protein